MKSLLRTGFRCHVPGCDDALIERGEHPRQNESWTKQFIPPAEGKKLSIKLHSFIYIQWFSHSGPLQISMSHSKGCRRLAKLQHNGLRSGLVGRGHSGVRQVCLRTICLHLHSRYRVRSRYVNLHVKMQPMNMGNN